MSGKTFAMRVLIILLLAGAAVVIHSASQDPLRNIATAEGEKHAAIAPASTLSVQAVAVWAPGWQQVNTSGFGVPQAAEVSALGVFNGYLYAGTHNALDGARIYRSANGTEWNPVTEPGFGNPHDIRPPAILDLAVFRERLYASTGRGDGPGQIYRSVNGLVWAPMVIHGFGDPDIVDVTALVEYKGMIYAGATDLLTGAQVWRSLTGDNNSWKQVAPAVPGTAPAWVTSMAEFNGALYAAVESEAPAQIWRSSDGADWTTVVSNGFGSSSTTLTGGMAHFGGKLYVGAGNTKEGAQLWRTGDGTNWEPAISPGLGDPNNQQVEMVFVFQEQLYISLENTKTGLEIWRSADGTNWEQANPDGFGDQNNAGSNASNAVSEFLGALYVGTVNDVDGGELWRFEEQPGSAATPTAASPSTTPGPTATSTSTPVPTLSPSSSKLYFPVLLPRR